MKRSLLVAAIFLITGINGYGQVSAIYVSPHGNDYHSGSQTAPCRTLGGALQKVSTQPEREVVILLRTGTYYLDTTLVIDPAVLGGHRLVIRPYQQEKVIISGATPLFPRWQKWKGPILQANIGKGLILDQLFCHGRLLHQARYPNYDPGQRVFGGTAGDAISPERIKTWQHPSGGYVHALHEGEWGDFHYLITGVDSSGALRLEGGWQNNRPAAMHTAYRFVENILEELDAPGEWYYDQATGILYLYPPAGSEPAKGGWEYSRLDQLIAVHGNALHRVKDVTIRGIGFTGTNRTFMKTREPLLRSDWTVYRGGAVLVEGSEKIVVSDCRFENLGGNAVFVSYYNRGVVISGNLIDKIGGSGILFVGNPDAVRSPCFQYGQSIAVDSMDLRPGPKTDNYPSECLAYDNLIHDIGTTEKQVAGIGIDMAMRIRASHNTIYNVPRAGINIGDGCWGGDTIEFNDVFNTVLETGDHGAFNAWGRDRYWLPDINAVDRLVGQYPALPRLDAIEPIVLRNNRFACARGWDIDLDDGSTNYHIYNNVCLTGGLKLREGFNRVVENNVIVNNGFHPHVWYKEGMDVFRYNIAMSDYAPIRIEQWGKEVDSNFFLRRTDLESVRSNGTDVHSLSGDPAFIDAATGDYRVKPGSKALGIGFHNFPMEEFGVISPRLKVLVRQPSIPVIHYLQTPRKGSIIQWNGASIKNIETLGERSASGVPDQNGVLIVKVAPGSLAEKSGLQPGDVIRGIEAKVITNTEELLAAAQTLAWKGQVSVVILHNQQVRIAAVFLR